MKQILFFIVTLTLMMGLQTAYAGSQTLVTYYPAPAGNYAAVSANSVTLNNSSCPIVGSNQVALINNSNQLQVCLTGNGTQTPVGIGAWTQAGNNVYTTNSGLNVGIGISDPKPSSTLTVNGNIVMATPGKNGSTSTIQAANGSITNPGISFASDPNTGHTNFGMYYTSTNGAQIIFSGTSGGTARDIFRASSVSGLNIAGNPITSFSSITTCPTCYSHLTPVFTFGDNPGAGMGIASGSQDLTFYTNGVVQETITNGGNVGIGVATPTQKLDVTGNTNVTGNSTISGNSTVSGTLQVSGGTLTNGAVAAIGGTLKTNGIVLCDSSGNNCGTISVAYDNTTHQYYAAYAP